MIQSRKSELEACRAALERINYDVIAQNCYLLSIAAKVHLIVAERGGVTVDALKGRAAQLGWKLSVKDIHHVAGYLQHLGLVTED